MSAGPRNIVICLDGTGNHIEENLSNVLKLYRTVIKDEEQIVFYDQGVGTLEQASAWGRRLLELKNILGLAFGYGLDRNVLEAYNFLVRHYQEHKVEGKSRPIGDNIYIFGFSRGSYTARVLAGLIYEVGILRPEQINLSPAALTAYKTCNASSNETRDEEDYESSGANFRRITNPRVASIRFLGLWDTVSSVFVPKPKGIIPWLVPQNFAHTSTNPAVRIMRQAMSIDERRRMFRISHWDRNQVFKPNPHTSEEPDKQDAEEVWFSGVHSDVGGGYPRADSGLSQIPFIWMLEHAEKAGLKVFSRMAKYISGQEPYSTNTIYLYPKPDPAAKLHNSLTPPWWILEILPKRTKYRDWPKRWSFLGFYLPLGEPRFIEEGSNIHPSVFKRMKAVPDYRPVNVELMEQSKEEGS